MKHCFRVPAVLAVIFIVVSSMTMFPSQLSSATYIGMYADEAHTQCSAYPLLYQVVYFWVWVQPGEDGMMCVEYEITVPANVIEAATIVNPEAGYHIGDAIVPPGALVCFPSCKTEWIWIHQLTCLVISETPSVITLDPHDDYGILRATNCVSPGDPYEAMTKINDMFLYQDCVLSSRPSSWGAIKSQLR